MMLTSRYTSLMTSHFLNSVFSIFHDPGSHLLSRQVSFPTTADFLASRAALLGCKVAMAAPVIQQRCAPRTRNVFLTFSLPSTHV